MQIISLTFERLFVFANVSYCLPCMLYTTMYYESENMLLSEKTLLYDHDVMIEERKLSFGIRWYIFSSTAKCRYCFLLNFVVNLFFEVTVSLAFTNILSYFYLFI